MKMQLKNTWEARYDSRLLRVVVIHVVWRWWWLESSLLLRITGLRLLLEVRPISTPDVRRERRDMGVAADAETRINASLGQCLLQ